MKKMALILMLPVLPAFAQIDMGGVDIQGDLRVLDNPDTSDKEGSLTVQNNATIGGILSASKISFLDPNQGAILIGDNTSVATGKMGIALGMNALVGGNGAIALGYNAEAWGNNSFALGAGAKTAEGSALAAGGFAKATGESAIAFGANSESSGGSSITLGANTKAQGDNSIASGAGSVSSGQASFSGGINSQAIGDASLAIGKAVESGSFGQATFGLFNEQISYVSSKEWVGTDPIFVIGNGDGTKRSNALVVLKNGDMEVNGTLKIRKPSAGISMGEFALPSEDLAITDSDSQGAQYSTEATDEIGD